MKEKQTKSGLSKEQKFYKIETFIMRLLDTSEYVTFKEIILAVDRYKDTIRFDFPEYKTGKRLAQQSEEWADFLINIFEMEDTIEDCIKTEELRMYSGTFLKCKNENYKQPSTFVGIQDYKGEEVLLAEFSDRYGAYDIREIQPLLKPLTSLSAKELKYLGDEFHYEKELFWFSSSAHSVYVLKCINYLTAHHYDISNMLGRNLAHELKEILK